MLPLIEGIPGPIHSCWAVVNPQINGVLHLYGKAGCGEKKVNSSVSAADAAALDFVIVAINHQCF